MLVEPGKSIMKLYQKHKMGGIANHITFNQAAIGLMRKQFISNTQSVCEVESSRYLLELSETMPNLSVEAQKFSELTAVTINVKSGFPETCFDLSTSLSELPELTAVITNVKSGFPETHFDPSKTLSELPETTFKPSEPLSELPDAIIETSKALSSVGGVPNELFFIIGERNGVIHFYQNIL